MAHLQRFVSFALLILGVALVFLGLTRSLGVTPVSVLASAAAIAALLYTGGVWFSSAAPRPQVVSFPPGAAGPTLFGRDGRVIAGPAAGQPVTSQFPESLRPDIERHCAAVFAGRTARFLSTRDHRPLTFDVLPVLGADGTIVYGVVVPLDGEVALAAV